MSVKLRWGKQPYTFKLFNTKNLKPLKDYLDDNDFIKVLKIIYSESTLDQVIEDNNIIVSFFGGEKSLLENVTEEE